MDDRPLFHYLSQIAFESETEKEDIQQRGWLSKPSEEALRLGQEFRKEILEGVLPKLSIRLINEKVGHGAFLEEPLPEGAFVGEYTGIVRRNDMRRYFNNNYNYRYPVEDINGIEYVIDATAGNLTRFINHSAKPNLKPSHAFIEGFYHLIFRTLRPLDKGTQLSFHYGDCYWYLREWPQDL